LEDEKISHYLDFSREMAASQSEDKKTSPQVLEFLKLLDSLNFKFPILKHTVALYHFVKVCDNYHFAHLTVTQTIAGYGY